MIDGVIYAESRQAYVTNDLHYLFDENGTRIGFVHNGTYAYYYRFNLQGDVTGIYSSTGNLIVEYTYDAWGKPNAPTGDTEIGNLNPIRYRGYYYDSETGLYYVSSRYYDPETCRFVNCDAIDVLNASPLNVVDKNLYAYCDNNPVVRIDVGGQFWDTVFDVVSLVASVVDVCKEPTDVWSWVGLVADAVDLVPFLTGVGETTRALKLSNKIDDTLGVAKVTNKANDIAKNGERVFNVSKQNSKIFREFKSVKGKSYKTSGFGRNKRFYKWDYTHNDIEVFDHKGKHLGSMDPITGKIYKGAVKGRTLW